MTTTDTQNARKSDVTLVRVLFLILATLIVNALVAAAFALSVQHEFNQTRANEIQQGQVTVEHLCKTLTSLYADKPPAGSAADNPSRAYLQELHDRLGELAFDLKC